MLDDEHNNKSNAISPWEAYDQRCKKGLDPDILPDYVAMDSSSYRTNDFSRSFTQQQRDKLQQSEYLVVQIKTTTTTFTDASVRVGRSTMIGGIPYSEYQKKHPECEVNGAPGVRVITIQTSSNETFAWDLDRLTGKEQDNLIEVILGCSTLIGYNLSFILGWLLSLTDTKSRPENLIDIMVIAKIVLHAIPLYVHANAGDDNEDSIQFIDECKDNKADFSYASLVLASTNLTLDITYDDTYNWAVTTLSTNHYFSCLDGIDLVLKVLLFIFKENTDNGSINTVDECIEFLDDKFPIYKDGYEPTIVQLAELHNKGLPFDKKEAELLAEDLVADIEDYADELIESYPVFAPIEEKLYSLSSGVTREILSVWKEFFKHYKCPMPTSYRGMDTIGSKAVKLSGVLDNQTIKKAWFLWEKLFGFKAEFRLLEEYLARVETERLHSLMELSASTLRMYSRLPNVQGVPKKSYFKKLFMPPKRKKILTFDYSQIELRIVAGLISRAISQIDSSDDKRVYDAIKFARSNERIPNPSGKKIKKENLWNDKEVWDLARALRSVGYPDNKFAMAESFRKGIDIHLLTALTSLPDVTNITGRGITPFDYINDLAQEDVEQLKQYLKTERQQAKAQNFGLLYGMGDESFYKYGITDYNLNWTQKEANQNKNNWFKMYPEIGVWHELTNLNYRWAKLYIKKYGDFSPSNKNKKVYQGKTLSGRELYTHKVSECLNYQGQGTGADILSTAIASVRKAGLGKYLINLVHDELVFEVPANKADEISSKVRRIMIKAADKFLSPYDIPVEVDSAIADYWDH